MSVASGARAARFLCTPAARSRGDALPGSAPLTRRWLLVEHPGPWGHDALAGLVPPEIYDAVGAAVRAQRGRALVVRRPGRMDPSAELAWGVLDQPGGGARWGRWREPADLLGAAAALADPEPLPMAPSQTLLVCTHGRHDTCCAVWGRPVAAALAQRWPEQTWESSHLGGDRFAAGLLVAPDGLYYGYLDPSSAIDVVTAHLDGSVDATYLRGSTAAVPVAQAALVDAHARFGPLPPRGVRVIGVVADGTDRWRVSLGIDMGTAEAVVVRTRLPPAQLSCRAAGSAVAAQYRVDSLTRQR